MEQWHRKKLKLFALFAMLLIGQVGLTQVSYNYGWEETGLGGWINSGEADFSSITYSCEGANSVRANIYDSNPDAIFTSPNLGTSDGSEALLSFSYRVTDYIYGPPSTADSAYTFEIEVQWANSISGPWTTFHTIDEDNHVPSVSCTISTETFTPGEGDLYVRFNSQSLLGGDVHVYFDNISVIQGDCLPPTALSVSNISTEGATLSWTSEGDSFDVEIVEAGDEPTGTPTESGVPNPFTVEDLDPSTTYEFYVRQDCGDGDLSAWAGPFSFATLCVAEDVPYVMPIDATTGADLPMCVTIENLNNDSSFWESGATTDGFEGRTMRYDYNPSNAANDWMYTNGLNLEGGKAIDLFLNVKI